MPDKSPVSPTEFGERLLRGREQKKRSLEEIAESTKIGVHQLRSLEQGDLHRLPGGVYRRAIVRQYAAAVGLNVDDTLRDLATITREVDESNHAHPADAAPRSDVRPSSFSTALWSGAAALIVLGAAAAVGTAWYRAGTTAPAADVRATTTTSTSAPDSDAPAVALVTATEPVRATAGDVGLATASAVSQNEPETSEIPASDETEGTLRITSDPAGAQITVNGIGWGATPVTIPNLPFGSKVIRATKPGYVSAQRGLEFAPDHRVQSVRIRLSPETR